MPLHLPTKQCTVGAQLKQRAPPAGVYEYVADEATGQQRLQINAQNCLHCKVRCRHATQLRGRGVLLSPPCRWSHAVMAGAGLLAQAAGHSVGAAWW